MAAAPSKTPTTAYKILTAPQWAGWHRTGRFAGAGIDVADGYIHLSTASTAGETFERYFSDQADHLVVVEVDLTKLGDGDDDSVLKWEESRGGALFPHVYGKGGVPLGAVRRRWEGGEVGKGLFEGLAREEEEEEEGEKGGK